MINPIEYYNSEELVEQYIQKDLPFVKKGEGELIAALEGIPYNGKKALDVGCGYGRDVAFMRSLGIDAFGVDGASAMVKKAQEMYGSFFNVLTFSNLHTIPDNAYEIIHNSNVLVHIDEEDINSHLEHLVRILKPKGVLILGSKEGVGHSVSKTMKMERITNLHSKKKIGEKLECLGMELIEKPYSLSKPSENAALLFKLRAIKLG